MVPDESDRRSELSVAELGAAAETVRRLLDAVESGDLTASGSLVARLEGALIALKEIERRLDPETI